MSCRRLGVDAPGFFVETATHLVIEFRGVRDSGITWRFLAGHRADGVQREAGDEDIATTLGYAKEVEDRRRRYGAPFPLFRAGPRARGPDAETPRTRQKRSARRSMLGPRRSQRSERIVGRPGLEPGTYGLKVRSSTD